MTSTASDDYVAVEGTLVFAFGTEQLSQCVDIVIVDDEVPEDAEKFTINISTTIDTDIDSITICIVNNTDRKL